VYDSCVAPVALAVFPSTCELACYLHVNSSLFYIIDQVRESSVMDGVPSAIAYMARLKDSKKVREMTSPRCDHIW